ncbi:hypothetical protein ACSZNV_04065 [Aeromonas hydrophila]|uniref:hypothetical protein n=1 Tax=Aeromonas hydrophila TaxID=644 RepID=UPI001CC6C7B8|nr:hypothetical protein [Aeromonas hydrophila]GJC03519.1 hypothetical protein KAM385_05480 [Aeromonas hydrophila]
MENIFLFLEKFWLEAFGLTASIIGIYEFIRVRISKKKIPTYSGALDNEFADFIYKNEKSVFFIDISLCEEKSKEIYNWMQSDDAEKTIWFSVRHDEYGTEFGFFKNDPEIHWNTRFWDSVHTRGYFKVHSIQGPYQGWMSVTLKGVGKEHINS